MEPSVADCRVMLRYASEGSAGATSVNPVTLKHKSYTHRAALQPSTGPQFSQPDGKWRCTVILNHIAAFSFLKTVSHCSVSALVM